MTNDFRQRRLEIFFVLLTVMAALFAYWPSFGYDFVFDDKSYIVTNSFVQMGWSKESVAWAFGRAATSSWQPVTWLSLMLDYEFWGLDPAGYKAVNLGLHILSGLLLFFVFLRTTGAFWPSVLVSAFFIFHPINVESVVWASQRKNTLSAFFWMFCMWGYVWYAERPKFWKYILVTLLFILGLMSKLTIATFPLAMLLLDYWPLTRFKSDGGSIQLAALRLILEKLPWLMLAVGVIFVLVYFDVNQQLSDIGRPMGLRLANALVTYVKYIGKIVWPSDMAVWYPFPDTIPLWQIIGAFGLLLVISAVVFKSAGERPYLLVGWLWYLGVMFPASGLIQSKVWPAMADHHAYLPSIGLFMMAVWGGGDLTAKLPRPNAVFAIISVFILFPLAITTRHQVQYWESGYTLWKHTLEVTDNNALAHNNFGEALLSQKKLKEAFGHFRKALDIEPQNQTARGNLGVALIKLGKYQKAVEHLEEALRLDPKDSKSYTNLGVAFWALGETEKAREYFEQTLRLKTDDWKVYVFLGSVLNQLGKYREAIEPLSIALHAGSEVAMVHLNLGEAYAGLKFYEIAFEHYQEALRLKPGWMPAQERIKQLTPKVD